MLSHCYLGVDIGGSKSLALLCDETGTVLAMARQGCGNPDFVGYDGLACVLNSLLEEVTVQAGVDPCWIRGAGFGISGYDWPSQLPALQNAVNSLRLPAHCEVVNDMLLGLAAGTRDGWGVVVGAGTGCNARGLDPAGREGRMLGCGLRFGEQAGAIELVEEATRAVALAWTRRSDPTSLTGLFQKLTGAASPGDLLEGLALNRYRIEPTAAVAILKEAQRGDRVAAGLVQRAGEGLGSMAVGVARQLDLLERPFQVVTMGSLFQAGEQLLAPMRTEILRHAPLAELTPLSSPPVAGAVLLGMHRAGIDPRPIRERLVQELSRRAWLASPSPG
jgi:N-acetylglucosamine kinase-like BadF-type ATPase